MTSDDSVLSSPWQNRHPVVRCLWCISPWCAWSCSRIMPSVDRMKIPSNYMGEKYVLPWLVTTKRLYQHMPAAILAQQLIITVPLGCGRPVPGNWFAVLRQEDKLQKDSANGKVHPESESREVQLRPAMQEQFNQVCLLRPIITLMYWKNLEDAWVSASWKREDAQSRWPNLLEVVLLRFSTLAAVPTVRNNLNALENFSSSCSASCRATPSRLETGMSWSSWWLLLFAYSSIGGLSRCTSLHRIWKTGIYITSPLKILTTSYHCMVFS